MNHEALDHFTIRKSFLKITKNIVIGHLLNYIWDGQSGDEWMPATINQIEDQTLLSTGQVFAAIENLSDRGFIKVRKLTQGANLLEIAFLVDREKVIKAIAALTEN